MKIKMPDFSDVCVLVIGDLMLDRYWHGETARISPEAPVPVVRIQDLEERPGGAGNVALNTASLGCKTQLMAMTGCDNERTTLKSQLNAANVTNVFHEISDKPTITKLRVLSRHQQLIRLDFEHSFSETDTKQLLHQLESLINSCDVVIFSDYGKGISHIVRDVIQLAQQEGKPVLVDPKGRDFSQYQGASIITPNLSEFEAVVGPCGDDKTIVEKAQTLIHELSLDALLVTRGAIGMSLIKKNGDSLHLPAYAKEVFDVTGAGDTVISTLAASIAANYSLEDATQLANLAASYVVTCLGAVAIPLPALRRTLHSHAEGPSRIVNEATLKHLIQDAKAQDETVVMTNGCFDILHAGHVDYLNQAKALGDRLIVAVNTDDSIRRLKGKDRPINELEQRMQVLAGLSAVDWVIPFSEDTPQKLIGEMLPDILVKGSDYRIDDIAGAKEVTRNGGIVKTIDLVAGVSTSNTIDKIRKTVKKPSAVK